MKLFNFILFFVSVLDVILLWLLVMFFWLENDHLNACTKPFLHGSRENKGKNRKENMGFQQLF